MDGSQKLPQRILGTIVEAAAGRPVPWLTLAVAAWMRYTSGRGEDGQGIEVKTRTLRNWWRYGATIPRRLAGFLSPSRSSSPPCAKTQASAST